MPVPNIGAQKPTRRPPDVKKLTRLIEAGVRRREKEGKGRVSHRQLGVEINRSAAFIHGILEKNNKPDAHAFVALADFFGDPREIWLEAGGFDVTSLPGDQNLTTQERELKRLWDALTPEQQAEELARLERYAQEALGSDG